MIRSILLSLVSAILVLSSYWNIFTFSIESLRNLAPRETEDLFIQEDRFRGIREHLIAVQNRDTPIAFVTTRDLRAETPKPEDDVRWSQAQYVMFPWLLVRNKKTVGGAFVPNTDPPLVIGDFSGDEPVPELPADFIKVYDAGNGLILFQKRPSR